MIQNLMLVFAILIPLSAETADAMSTISVTIVNPSIETLTIDEETVIVNEDGSFHYSFSSTSGEIHTLLVSGQPIRLYVNPGENLLITFDESNPCQTISFQGESAPINSYLIIEDRINAELAPVFRIGQEHWVSLFQLEEEEFLQRLDFYRQRYYDALEQAGLDNQQFLSDREISIRLAFDWVILQYPHFHRRYTGIPTELSIQTVEYLEEINLDDPALLSLEGYFAFASEMLHSKIRWVFIENEEVLSSSDNQWLQASLQVVSEVFHHPDTRAYLEFHFIRDHIERNGIKNLLPFIEAFNPSGEYSYLDDALTDIYQSEITRYNDHLIMTYKTVDGFDLDAHVFLPEDLNPDERRPAVIYLHGGSWSEGKPDWQFGTSRYGFVNICIEYRTYERYRSLPTDAVADAKSAIRWVRMNAVELNVDANRIIVSGNSAGGHLALCTVMVDDFDETDEDLSVSSCPDALILTSAVYDLDGNSWFAGMLDSPELLESITPLLHIDSGLPPMLMFHGSEYVESAPFLDCERFIEDMRQAGNTVHFYPIAGKGHFLWQYEIGRAHV